MQLSERELICLPGEGGIEFYRNHGWWVGGRLFTDDELELIAEAARRHQHGHRDAALPSDISPELDWSPAYGERLRVSDYIAYQSRDIRRVAIKPIIGAIAGQLAGVSEVRLFNSSFVEKPPAGERDDYRVKWHTDRAFWRTCTSVRMLSAWIPLEDANHQNGTLIVLDGSHAWPRTAAVAALQQEKNFISGRDGDLPERAAALGMPVEAIPIVVGRGCALFFHCLLVHASGPNRTATSRRALLLHLQDGENRYQEAYENGKREVNNNDLMVRRRADGQPDYSDPDFCPVMWRDEVAGTHQPDHRNAKGRTLCAG